MAYAPEFFAQYQPITALDMVERLPGFTIDDGDGSRGFGGAAGNLLINGERPSTKQDTVSQILRRIPANQVQRLELIRGQGGGLDLRGQAVAVNVVLRTDSGPAFTWQVDLEQDFDSGGLTPLGNLAATNRFGATQVNFGLQARRFFFGNPAEEILFSADQAVEQRDEFERTKGNEFSVSMNTETRLDETVVHFNSEIGYEERDFIERSLRTPLNESRLFRNIGQDGDEDEFRFEVGGDIEWSLAEAWRAKAILLYRQEDEDETSGVNIRDEAMDLLEARQATTTNASSESIARLEFDWNGWSAHTVEIDLEGAFNTLDNELALTLDDGNGPQPIPVPGANTRVEEVRGDIRLADSWVFGHWVMETALGAELSNISQSGDTPSKRDFFFFKPSYTLTHTAARGQQTRLRILREVAQLDFNDFVSSTNFNDDDVDLGNADLIPARTWVAELSHERRFGELGAATLTLFHNWVDDVQDLLPIGGIFEAPGNIGNGRRWGVELETTLPLHAIGIAGGRLDIDARWQDSSVNDPVTERRRVFSLEREFNIEIDFRQDLQKQRWAWGWSMALVGESPFFGIDELDINDRGVDTEIFIETTRWWGVKMRLTLQNLIDREFIRDRRVFTTQRNLSPLAFRELRDRRRGRSIVFSISGSF